MVLSLLKKLQVCLYLFESRIIAGDKRNNGGYYVTCRKNLDFQAQLKTQEDAFPMLRILDETGKAVDTDGERLVNLSDKELVELMERMVFSRTLNDRSTKLAKQGRLGFLHQRLVKRHRKQRQAMLLNQKITYFLVIVICRR